MSSIRRTLTLWLLGGLALVLVLGGVGLYLTVRAALTRQFDDVIAGRSAALSAAIKWDEGKVEVDFHPEAMPWYKPGPHAEYFEILNPSAGENTLVLASPSLSAAQHINPGASPASAQDHTLPDGRPGRVLLTRINAVTDPPDLTDPEDIKEKTESAATGTPPELLLIVARGREDLDSALRVIGVSLIAVGVCTAVGVVLVVRAALRRGLRPLDRLSQEVTAMQAASLSRRLDPLTAPVELQPVYTRLNDLFARLQSAFDRERRFTAAAAHELRTPVSELRSMLEVTLSRPRPEAETSAAMHAALGVTLQMQSLVESLFDLTRSDVAKPSAPSHSFDLTPILLRVLTKHAVAASHHGGQLDFQPPPAAVHARADPHLVEAILNNVLSNAVDHAAPKPNITVVLSAQGKVSVEVRNPVQSLAPADVARFFEPFWRRSDSRTERHHSGLGLTIARQLAQRMGGTLEASLAGPDHLCVRLELPSGDSI